MSKTYDHYHEDPDDSDEVYRKKRQDEEDQHYKELMEQADQIELMNLDVTDCSEEELFNQILRDEREVNMEVWEKIKAELNRRKNDD